MKIQRFILIALLLLTPILASCSSVVNLVQPPTPTPTPVPPTATVPPTPTKAPTATKPPTATKAPPTATKPAASATPAATATLAPTATKFVPTATELKSGFKLLSMTQKVSAQKNASVKIQTAANALCRLTFIAPNGQTVNSYGTGKMDADDKGICEWKFPLGNNTKPGIGKVTITADGMTKSFPIEITK